MTLVMGLGPRGSSQSSLLAHRGTVSEHCMKGATLPDCLVRMRSQLGIFTDGRVKHLVDESYVALVKVLTDHCCVICDCLKLETGMEIAFIIRTVA